MFFNIVAITIAVVVTDLLVDILVDKKMKKELAKHSNNIEKALSEANGITHNKDGSKVYVFSDLPEETQEVVLEYLPPQFYDSVGEESYHFLNIINTEQLRIYNRGLIETYKTIIPKVEEFKYNLKTIRVGILYLFIIVLLLVKNG